MTFSALSNVTLWHWMQPCSISFTCLSSSYCSPAAAASMCPWHCPSWQQVPCCCMECAKGNPSVAYPNSIFCSVELNWSKHSFSTAPFTTFQHFTVHNIISLHDRHNWPKTPYAKLVRFFGRSTSSFHSYHMTQNCRKKIAVTLQNLRLTANPSATHWSCANPLITVEKPMFFRLGPMICENCWDLEFSAH